MYVKCDPGCTCARHKPWTKERREATAERARQDKPWTHRKPKNEVQRPQRHVRVENARGKVTDYECVVCRERNAEAWAQVRGADPYDVYGYQPMCRKCHYWYDVELHPHVNGRWAKKGGDAS